MSDLVAEESDDTREELCIASLWRIGNWGLVGCY
jgi:hypothetical protein